MASPVCAAKSAFIRDWVAMRTSRLIVCSISATRPPSGTSVVCMAQPYISCLYHPTSLAFPAVVGGPSRRSQPASSHKRSQTGNGEGASVGSGCRPGGPGEMPAKMGGGAEAAGVRHALDGQVGLLQQLTGQQDPLAQQPLERGGPGLGAEAAGERSWRHPRVSGEPSQVQPFLEGVQRPAAGGQQRRSASLGGRDGLLDELRLVAVAV